MIIRSQDKKAIANFDNMDSICIERNHCGCDVVGYNGTLESCVKLGKYSTEGKAIKVLDMIQEKYCMTNASNCMMTGTMRSLLEVTKEIQDKTVKAHRDLYVFEMPADNEVEV